MSAQGGRRDGRRRWSLPPGTSVRHGPDDPPPERLSPSRLADLSLAETPSAEAPEPPPGDEESPGEPPPDPALEADALAGASDEPVPAVPDSQDAAPETLPAGSWPEDLPPGPSDEADELVGVLDESDSAVWEPEVPEPEVSEAEVFEPEVSVPEVSVPEVSEPEVPARVASGTGRHRSQEPRSLLARVKFWG